AYLDYFRTVAALPVFPDGTERGADVINDLGAGIVGTPDDVCTFIDHLVEQSAGGFGTLLVQAHEWANPEATLRSYELMAEHVFPRFQGSAQRPLESRDWVMANRAEHIGAAGEAISSAYKKHVEEQAALAAEEPAAAD